MRTALLLLVIMYSCSPKENREQGFTTTKSRFDYKIIRSASAGDTVRKGDIVKVHLRQFIDDSLLNDTHNTLPVYVVIDSTLREFDFSEILPYMRVNDSAVCIFPVAEILRRAVAETYPPNFLKKGKNIRVYLKVVQTFSSDSLGRLDYVKESQLFDDRKTAKEKAGYDRAASSFDSLIATLKQPLVKLQNGTYVQMIRKGAGKKIKQSDSVAVVYKGMLFNGHPFENTTREKPFIFSVGEGNAVEGFDTGIASLTFGDLARLFIPAKLAYGSNPAGDIPPFSNLIFEVEVYDGRP